MGDWADKLAAEKLPCDGGWSDLRCTPTGSEEIHRSGCQAKQRSVLAAEVRNVWLEAVEAAAICVINRGIKIKGAIDPTKTASALRHLQNRQDQVLTAPTDC